MKKDKKIQSGRLKFILPTSIGKVIQVTDVTHEEIISAINYISLI